jgi:DNA-directed RNA polymerase subunit RPC12/RpoP
MKMIPPYLKRISAAAILYGLWAQAGWAGTGYHLECTNSACRYEVETVIFGEGMFHERLTGYCTKCTRFVYLTWKKGRKKPEPTGAVWDAETGKTWVLYGCPRCKKPFLPIPEEKTLKHCPKCSKASVKKKAVLAVD